MLSTCELIGDAIVVTLAYPRIEPVRAVEIDLSDVRASDGIRVTYDFDRDGWVIWQASIFEWEAGDEEQDPDWQEVAFVRSWARDPRSYEP